MAPAEVGVVVAYLVSRDIKGNDCRNKIDHIRYNFHFSFHFFNNNIKIKTNINSRK
jgi:hypothetical protein